MKVILFVLALSVAGFVGIACTTTFGAPGVILAGVAGLLIGTGAHALAEVLA